MFRVETKLSLDDCLYSLQDAIPHLKRANLQRVFERHGISVLPNEENDKRETKTFTDCPIGYCHVDIAQVNTEEASLDLFVAIDRTARYAQVALHANATTEVAAQILENLLEQVPFNIHTILTDHGSKFTNPRKPKVSIEGSESVDLKPAKSPKHKASDAISENHNIEHRLTLSYHPWTIGQVERRNRSPKSSPRVFAKKVHVLGTGTFPCRWFVLGTSKSTIKKGLLSMKSSHLLPSHT